MQTTHTEYSAQYTEGQVTENFPYSIRTLISEDSGSIGIGVGLVVGANDNTAKLPAGAFTPDAFAGIVIRSHTKMKAINTGTISYEDEEEMPVLEQGVLAVAVTGTVTKGATVFMQHTLNGGRAPGTFRADADTANAAKIPATFLTGGSNGDIVLIKVIPYADMS